MATTTTSKPITTSYQIRSMSFPFRSHPTILRIEEEVKKLETTLAASSLSMPLRHTKCILGLDALYECIEELLNLPTTQQAFCQYRSHEKWVDELLDGSVKVLDICCVTRDNVSQMKEHVRDIQCALRRGKGDSSIEKFTLFRKKIQKDAKKLIGNSKRVDGIIGGGSDVTDLNNNLVAVIRVLTKVSEVTVSVFESIFLFFYVKPKPCRWSIVSKMMHKGRVGCEGQQQQQGNVNELEILDAALLNVCRFGSNVEDDNQIAKNRLESMEAYIESIQSGLDCLFRHLIRTRALLLNILSQ